MKLLIETLDVISKVCFDHAGNDWVNRNGQLLFTQSYEGYRFPEEKSRLLELIEEGIDVQKGRAARRRLRENLRVVR